jgi:DNA-binding transcriptional MerR regulator
MLQPDLIKALGCSDSTFRRWRGGLGIPAKDLYSDEDAETFTQLKQKLDGGVSYADAIAQLTGNPTDTRNGFSDALVKGFKPQLQKQADAVGAGLAIAFEDMVWGSFLKHVSRSKGSRFEELADNFTLGIDTDEPLEAFLIEGATDEE